MSSNNGSVVQFPFSPSYSFIFWFEDAFDCPSSRKWMRENWHFSYYIGVLYIGLILTGKYLMKNRQPMSVQTSLAVWNIVLAMFSLLGAYRTFPELIYVVKEYGLHHSICVSSFVLNKISGFWGFLFVASKAVELLDTMFVIIRKQKLTHIHWFHHVVTLLICWRVFSDAPAMSRWMMTMNYSIHAVMYTYFALRALKFSIPRWVAMVITTSQITQMIAGLFGVCYSIIDLSVGGSCETPPLSLAAILFGYGTFFILFLNFFVQNYVLTPSAKKDSKKLN